MTRASLLRNSRISFSNFLQRRLVHRLNVKIADATARKFIHLLAALFHPTLIAQLAVGIGRNRFDSSLPGTFFAGLVVEGDFTLAVEPIVEQLPVVVAGAHRLAVDGDQIIAQR